MSIVALKRNSRRFQQHISGGPQGFSLNGGYRNIGAVGQTNLGRSVTRTRFRGAEPMGHGGCCGTYNRTISNSGSCCTNDSSIIKSSTKNTKGYIDSTIKHPTSVYNSCVSCPSEVNFSDNSPLNHSQSTYIHKVIAEVAKCEDVPDNTIKTCSADCDAASYHIGGRKIIRQFYSKTVNSATSAENYMRTSLLKQNCIYKEE